MREKASQAEIRGDHEVRNAKYYRRLHSNLPPYPNGWFRLLDSNEVRAGEIKRLDVLGLDLVVYRERKTQAVAVLDSYCPHLGADLSGGRLDENDCLQCPFHGWTFNRSGACVKLSYGPKDEAPPKYAKTRSWEVRESWGMIFLWHHADGEPPNWELPFSTQEKNGMPSSASAPVGKKLASYFEHVVGAHIQDLQENGSDLGHFHIVHDQLFSKHITMTWEASYKLAHEKHRDCISIDRFFLINRGETRTRPPSALPLFFLNLNSLSRSLLFTVFVWFSLSLSLCLCKRNHWGGKINFKKKNKKKLATCKFWVFVYQECNRRLVVVIW